MRYWALGAILAVVAGLGVMLALALQPKPDDQFAQCRTGRIAGGSADIGGDFELRGVDDNIVSSQTLFAKPTLLYFGYTFCPDICPFDMARNMQAIDTVSGGTDTITPVFITIDPARDTPEVLSAYQDYLDPKLVALTGTQEQIRRVATAYRAYFSRRDVPDQDTYFMDHTGFSYLTLPGHGMVEIFRSAPTGTHAGVTSEEMGQQLACFIKNMD